MPRDPGKQKRAQKQKKRRDERRKQRAERRGPAPAKTGDTGGLRPGKPKQDLSAVCGYDADVGVDAQVWLQAAPEERLSRVSRYHEVLLKPGKRPPSMPRHAGMHVLVENQYAEDAPPQVRQAISRLMRDGMDRHDAVHAVGWLLTEHMKRAVAEQKPVDERAYALELEQLSLQSWLSRARDAQ